MEQISNDYLNPKVLEQSNKEEYYKKENFIDKYLLRLNSYNRSVLRCIHLNIFNDKELVKKQLQKEKETLLVLLSKMNFDLKDEIIILTPTKKTF